MVKVLQQRLFMSKRRNKPITEEYDKWRLTMPIIKKHGNTKRIENQAARLCGSKIAFPVTKPLSFYGPKHFYTQIFEMRNG